jgi:hypothetical protein
VQVEEAVVGGRRVNFEVAGMQHDTERRVDGERNTDVVCGLRTA